MNLECGINRRERPVAAADRVSQLVNRDALEAVSIAPGAGPMVGARDSRTDPRVHQRVQLFERIAHRPAAAGEVVGLVCRALTSHEAAKHDDGDCHERCASSH
jgi:hypothetical protein